jgi:hypothetical protein
MAKQKYKAGDVVEVVTRSTGAILLGRYMLVEGHGPLRSAWEAKHLKTGRVMTLYDDEWVSPGRSQTTRKE